MTKVRLSTENDGGSISSSTVLPSRASLKSSSASDTVTVHDPGSVASELAIFIESTVSVRDPASTDNTFAVTGIPAADSAFVRRSLTEDVDVV